MRAIHYCGEGVFFMLPGWPVCGSGDFAYKVRDEGNQTAHVDLVTCKKCLSKMTKSGLITGNGDEITEIIQSSSD